MIKENHRRLFQPKKTAIEQAKPAATQLPFYEAVIAASTILAAEFPNLTWQKERAKEKKDTKDKTKSVNTLKQQSLIILERLLGPDYWNANGEILPNAVENTMMMDWFNYVSEVSVGELRFEFEYQNDFGPGYKETQAELAKNFVYAQAYQDILSWRALTEQVVWDRLKVAMADATLDPDHDSVFLVTSAPDNVNYHGSTSSMTPDDLSVVEEHHSFIYMAMPKAGGLVQVTQLRAWHNYAQWGQIHTDFGAGFAFEQSSAGSQLFANVIQLRFPKGTSREDIEKQVMEKVYKKEFVRKWHIKPDELPQFSQEGEKRLWVEVMGMTKEELMAASSMLAAAMAHQTPLKDLSPFANLKPSLVKEVFLPELLTTLRDAKQNINPSNKAHYAERVEALQQLLISTSQQKVEWYNNNPKYVIFALSQALKKFPENPTGSLNTIKRLLAAQLLHHMPLPKHLLKQEQKDAREFLTLNTTHLTNPKSLTSKQAARFAQLTAKYAFNFTIGSALCHGMDVIKAAASGVGGEILMNFGSAANFTQLIHLSAEAKKSEISTMTPDQAAQLASYYETFQYVELALDGANTTWMVATQPENWLEGLGCRVDPDNPQTGVVVGPCPGEFDGVFYPHGIPLDKCVHEPGGPIAATALEFKETLHLLHQRAQEKKWHDLSEKAKTKTTPNQQKEVDELLKQAYQHLIKRKVGLLEVINNDMMSHRALLDTWMTKIATLLEGPENPVLILRNVVEELLKHNPNTEAVLEPAA